MNKWLTKKNIIVIAVLFVFCIGVILFQKPVYDVEIIVSTADMSNQGQVVQLFWDDGTGYNAENSILTELSECTGTLKLPKSIVEDVISYRLDPVNGETDIIYEGITINGEDLGFADFLKCIEATVQTQTYLEEKADGLGEQLRFDVEGNDSQVYMNRIFSDYILQSSKMSAEEKGTLICCGMLVAFILIFYKEILLTICNLIEKAESVSRDVAKIHPRWKMVIVIVAIAFCSFIAMNQYILGDRYFLFVDAGDSYYQTYPGLLNKASYIEKGLIYDSYNFNHGLGKGLGAIKVDLTNWVAWFGQESVAYLLGISQFLKIFLAGVFFCGTMRIKGVENWYSLILGLGYAFCGHMAVRASWASYPNEVLLVAIWLFAFECWFQKRDIRWLPIATFLVFYHYGSGYYFILYILFLPAYALFRYFTERRIKGRIIGIVICGIVVVAMGYMYITDFAMVKQVLNVLQADRVQDVLNETDWSLNNFALDINLLPRIFGRTVGISVLGIIRNNYVEEYWNFLEDPTFFCGIVTLLIIPLAFYMMDVKKKICYLMLYIVATVYCLCEPLRVIVNGFSGITYKQSSFWIILVMLFTVSQIDFEEIKEKKIEKKCFLILSSTAVLLVGTMLYLPSVIATSTPEYKLSLLFIILEYVCLAFLMLGRNVSYFTKIVLTCIVCIETVCVSYPVYNDRNTVDGSSYQDDTILALEYLEEHEGDSFYRVDKQYISVHTCDSLAQSYNGTGFYVGGTGMGNHVSAFYNDLGLPLYSQNRMAWGTSAYNDVQTLLGIKFAFSKGDSVANYGYKEIGQTGDVTIYENENAMPMGFVYNYAIERSTFEKLNMKQRQRVLLKACLVEDGYSGLPLITEEQLKELEIPEELFDKYEIEFQSAENYSFVFEPTTADEVLVVKIVFDKKGRGCLCYSTTDGETSSILIAQEDEDTGQMFEIAVEGVNRIWSDSPNWAEIISLQFAKIPKTEYYASFESDVAQLKESAVNLSHYEDNCIEGTFYTEKSGMLYLPVINGGWQVYVDSEWQAIQTVNDAFIGVYVEAGEHTLKAIYPTGTFMSVYGSDMKKILACMTIAVLGTIWMHVKRKRGLSHERNISSSTSI